MTLACLGTKTTTARVANRAQVYRRPRASKSMGIRAKN